MTETKSLLITISPSYNNPEKPSLKDILGDEFDNYYDGCGFCNNTKKKDFFFYDVPVNLQLINFNQ